MVATLIKQNAMFISKIYSDIVIKLLHKLIK